MSQFLPQTPLVGMSPTLENLNSSQLEVLWAVVNYSTMSQKIKPASTPTAYGSGSPNFSSLFGLHSSESETLNTNHYFPPLTSDLNQSSPYQTLPLDAMSPFMSFLQGSSINFGG